jgi:hypothetical protein
MIILDRDGIGRRQVTAGLQVVRRVDTSQYQGVDIIPRLSLSRLWSLYFLARRVARVLPRDSTLPVALAPARFLYNPESSISWPPDPPGEAQSKPKVSTTNLERPQSTRHTPALPLAVFLN